MNGLRFIEGGMVLKNIKRTEIHCVLHKVNQNKVKIYALNAHD